MKLLLQLALTFFYHLVTAAPIPSQYRIVLAKDYLYYASAACPPSQRIAFLNTHFSSYQIINPSTTSAVAHQTSEHTFTNAKITAPEHLERSHALSAKVPSESSYLLSIANPATVLVQQGPPSKVISTTDAFAAKPTSALSYLRKADVIRYWANIRSGSSSDENERYDEAVTNDGLVMSGSTRICADGFSTEGFCCRESMFIAWGNGDLLICGILVLFLVGVIALEVAEMISDLLMAFGKRRRCSKVYSGDDEKAAQPQFDIVVNGHGDKGSDTKVEGF
ncbi:hypothetical protein BKA61DRAFT_603119 [Leptodontidium sp. MPI-SDFR-AT-0119]|nr:hypothetical protein BKA61DRAFT_603119 [Leptodontidium sp. MPI-SDFR-AT-0119]